MVCIRIYIVAQSETVFSKAITIFYSSIVKCDRHTSLQSDDKTIPRHLSHGTVKTLVRALFVVLVGCAGIKA